MYFHNYKVCHVGVIFLIIKTNDKIKHYSATLAWHTSVSNLHLFIRLVNVYLNTFFVLLLLPSAISPGRQKAYLIIFLWLEMGIVY